MENMTKKEAIEELVTAVWQDGELWKILDHKIFNMAEFSNLDHKEEILYFAAVASDSLNVYLREYYSYAEQAQHVRNFQVCKDCYDYISSDDPGHVADIFDFHYGIDEGEMIFNAIEKCVKKIEENGEFWKEVPELLETFSTSKCDCCKSPLHGERFFLLFHGKFVE